MPVIVSSIRKTSHFLTLKRISHRLQPSRLKSSVELPVFSSAFNPNHKSHIAFTDYKGRNLSYNELGIKSLHVAKELMGVTKEPTQVSFLCPHCASFPITLWGTWLAGHTAVPLSSKHPDNLLAYFLKASKSQITVTVPAYAERLHRVAKEVGSQLVVIDIDRLDLDNDMETEQRYMNLQNSNQFPHADALILFTSGTTGQPKGVLLTHGNIQDQVSNICKSFEINEADTLLHVLPLHHTHGVIHALLSPLSVGARCHMLEKFSADQVWQQLLSSQHGRPTVLMGVPTVYVKLIEEYEQRIRFEYKPEVVKETCLQKMRLFLSGSASLPVPVLKKWESITGHRILERYGMTEVGVMLSNPLHGPRKPGFVGTPFPSVRVRLAEIKSKSSVQLLAEADIKNVRIFHRDQDGTVIGDLLTMGPSVFKGYFNNPEATAKEFTEDGWFITGDTVEYTEGSFKVLGRKSVDLIKSGGYKLSSLQIEAQLLALSEISEVAVMGIPDPVWGQRVAAVVVWSQGPLDTEELKQVAKSRLPSYMIPSVIKSVDHLPRNHLGKVNKKELAKVFDTKAV